MNKLEWLIFAGIFFIIALIYYRWSSMPDIVYLNMVDSYSKLALFLDNKIERTVSMISFLLSAGCIICMVLKKTE